MNLNLSNARYLRKIWKQRQNQLTSVNRITLQTSKSKWICSVFPCSFVNSILQKTSGSVGNELRIKVKLRVRLRACSPYSPYDFLHSSRNPGIASQNFSRPDGWKVITSAGGLSAHSSFTWRKKKVFFELSQFFLDGIKLSSKLGNSSGILIYQNNFYSRIFFSSPKNFLFIAIWNI